LLLCLTFLAPAAGARADLQVPLGETPKPSPQAKAVTRRAAPVAQAPPLASRGLARQIGVARRGGGPPILPPSTGVVPVEEPATAAPPARPAGQPTPVPPALEMRLGRILTLADVRRLPDPRSQWLVRLQPGYQVAVRSQWQGHYAILMGDGSFAYVPQAQVELLEYQVRTVLTDPTPTPQPPASPPPTDGFGAPNPLAEAVLREAFRYQDTPYVWGGNTEAGIDCSGLVKNVFGAQGIRLPRTASQQALVGQPVPLDQLQPGDRLYFSVKRANDHTGIYVGGGRFIHAGRSRGNVGVDDLNTAFYRRTLTSARR